MTEETDWDRSAQAWINSLGEKGDWGRVNVVDPALDRLFAGINPRKTLDIGCGEGRLCRRLQTEGVQTTGIDPTKVLIEQARHLDPHGDYREARAENLPFADAHFDCVVSCLSLIDIENLDQAISEMVRVLTSGGVLLVVNLTSFNTAGAHLSWRMSDTGERLYYPVDHYLDDRANQVAWQGIEVVNYHRPLRRYMQAYLQHGLQLEHFDEPDPVNPEDMRAKYYRRAPWINVMQWRKR